jgi:hypothetical protein
LFDVCNVAIIAETREWLGTHIPDWSDVAIAPHAEYLGFCLGPSAGSVQFDMVRKKWQARCVAISSAYSSMCVSTLSYNTYAASLWGYKLALLVLPPEFLDMERRLIHSILKLPFWALGPKGHLCLAQLGLSNMVSLHVLNLASLARAANVTIPAWREWHTLLRLSADDGLGAECLAHGRTWQKWWDSQPLVENLRLFDKRSPAAWHWMCEVQLHDVPRDEPLVQLAPSYWKRKHLLSFRVREELVSACNEPRVQRAVSAALRPLAQSLDLCSFLAARIQKYAAKLGTDGHAFDWSAWIGALGLLCPFAKSHVIRTVCNGWITATRMKQYNQLDRRVLRDDGAGVVVPARIPCCVFGCSDGLDDLFHYVRCEVLRTRLAWVWPWSDGLEVACRFGMSLNSKVLNLVAFCSFHYHAVRNETEESHSESYFLGSVRAFNVLTKYSLVAELRSPA